MSTTAKKKTTRKKAAPKSNGEVTHNRLKEDMLNLAGDTKQYAAQQVESLTESAKDIASDTKTKLSDVADKSQEVATENMERCVESIKKNPIAAVGIAAGVGFLAALFAVNNGRKS